MRTSCLPGDQDAHHSFTLPEMWKYPTLMKVVPDILKRRLGLHPRLAHEDLTFATSKLAHHLRVPPTPSSALPPRLPPPPPPCQPEMPRAKAPRWRPNLGSERLACESFKMEAAGAWPPGAGHAGGQRAVRRERGGARPRRRVEWERQLLRW